HFGVYAPARAARLAGALIALLGALALPGLALMVGAIAFGIIDPNHGLGIAALVGGLLVHIAAVEIGRAHLLVGAVTVASLLRGILMLGFGCAALLLVRDATALLLAIGLAHVVAALPVLLALRRTIWGAGFVAPQRADIVDLLAYGWPLILALMAGAVSINLDRIALSWWAGSGAVGPYGAVADIIRQSFVVLGEAIAAAYVSQAKAQMADTAAARAILQRAFVTLWVIVVFGVVGFALFGEGVIGVVLTPDYLDTALAAMPILVLGTACLVLRAYYFGQVIYFTGNARREVKASLLMVAVAILGCVTLVPAFGLIGAATTFAATQAAGLIYFLLADRTSAIMPIDWQQGGIALAAASGTATIALLAMLALGGSVGWFAGLLLTLAGGLALALAWNLFDLGRLAAYLLARLAPASRRS
ncbi:MAG TPA: oligosaccharide flippase family protein, partial [Devosia sp.]|nr:oligosaccharide flippase family protein [Devosia sp.]